MTRSRSWLIASALGLIAALPQVPAAADEAVPELGCQIKELALPAGSQQSAVLAGDATGRWFGGWYDDGDDDVVTRWKDGRRRDLDPPVPHFSIEGINRHGEVVGTALVGGVYRSYAQEGDQFVELTAPGAAYVFANAINSAGLVTGGVVDESGMTRAAVWRTSAPDDPTLLRVQPGYEGEGVGISERGEIALLGWPPVDEDLRSYVVDLDERRIRLRATQPGWVPWIQAIQDGWAAGIERDAGLQQRIIRWRLDRPRHPVAFASPMFVVHAVNASGVIGGVLRDADEHFLPGLVVGKRTKQLPGLGDEIEGEVRAVGSNGEAAGSALGSDGFLHAVTWTC